MKIEVVSDVICPWCFIGKRNLDVALAELAREGLVFELGFRPFQLNPDMPRGGMPRAEYRLAKFGSAEKSAELDARVTSAGKAAGIDFHFDRITRTPNTLAAHRLIRLAADVGAQPAVKEALMRAYFLEGRDIEALDVLAEIAATHGVDVALLEGDAGMAEVIGQDNAARQSGISGVPSFLMQNYFLFSGAMPSDALVENFRKVHGILQARGEG